ncbi:MAG: hypothetical protein LQ343_001982 [Gyalolechia ehrenbergii]|nr:MAG: hypothetical protein LQ343_001982 [Gyalolechia ehrenbergii]
MSSFTGDLSMVEREDRVAVQRSANIISKTEYLPSLPIPKWSSGPRSREELSMDRRQLGVQLSDLKPRIMVHAEASNFPANLSKHDVYTRFLTQAEALLEDERNWVADPNPPRASQHHGANQVYWLGRFRNRNVSFETGKADTRQQQPCKCGFPDLSCAQIPPCALQSG